MPSYCIELFAVHEYVYSTVEVEADTLEKAREKALELAKVDEASLRDFEYLPHGCPHEWQVNEDAELLAVGQSLDETEDL